LKINKITVEKQNYGARISIEGEGFTKNDAEITVTQRPFYYPGNQEIPKININKVTENKIMAEVHIVKGTVAGNYKINIISGSEETESILPLNWASIKIEEVTNNYPGAALIVKCRKNNGGHPENSSLRMYFVPNFTDNKLNRAKGSKKDIDIVTLSSHVLSNRKVGDKIKLSVELIIDNLKVRDEREIEIHDNLSPNSNQPQLKIGTKYNPKPVEDETGTFLVSVDPITDFTNRNTIVHIVPTEKTKSEPERTVNCQMHYTNFDNDIMQNIKNNKVPFNPPEKYSFSSIGEKEIEIVIPHNCQTKNSVLNIYWSFEGKKARYINYPLVFEKERKNTKQLNELDKELQNFLSELRIQEAHANKNKNHLEKLYEQIYEQTEKLEDNYGNFTIANIEHKQINEIINILKDIKKSYEEIDFSSLHDNLKNIGELKIWADSQEDNPDWKEIMNRRDLITKDGSNIIKHMKEILDGEKFETKKEIIGHLEKIKKKLEKPDKIEEKNKIIIELFENELKEIHYSTLSLGGMMEEFIKLEKLIGSINIFYNN